MRRFMMLLLPLCLMLACGPGEVGQPCQGGAAENDCVDGALCTAERSETLEVPDEPNAGETFACRALCDSEDQCPEEGFSCRRAAGTMLSTCQPDDVPPAE